MKLQRQMILLIAAPTLIIYIVVLGLTTVYTYRESRGAVERSMTQLAASYAARFDGQLREAAQIAETTAGFVQTAGPPPDAKLYELLERNVARSPLVYGAAMAFEPGTIKPADVLFAPYVCRGGGGFRRMDIDRSVYDWHGDPRYTWFTRPKSLGRGVWSDPYFDEGAGNILMATYSAVFDLGGSFGGVCTVDIDLPRLHTTVRREFVEDLDFVILTADGRFVYDPDAARILSKTIFDVAAEGHNPALAALGTRMLKGGSGAASVGSWDSPEPQWVFFAPIRSTGWVFACRVPESRVLADVRRRAAWSGAALGVTLLLIVACIIAVSRSLAAPIARLNDKVSQVAGGDLEARVDETSRTAELRTLAGGFNRMTLELRSQVERLAAERAARAGLEQDLELAREIQQSLLPAADPANEHLDIVGRSRYCDATGGDYYDFIDISELSPGAALIAIGDVTGHGIASALLMASVRAALRVQAGESGQLSDMLSRVNRLLSLDNRHARFMTITLLVIDPERGAVRWACAGHDPAIVFHPDTGAFEELEGGGLPLGIDADEQYQEHAANPLRPGDILVLGTDGIWELRDTAGRMFGKERLRELMRRFGDRPARELAAAIERQLDEFRGEVNQQDDITYVVVRVK